MQFFFLISILSLLQPLCVMGHGNMAMPTTWFDAGGKVGTKAYAAQCGAGCDQSVGNQSYCSCLWFTNETTITPGSATIFDNSLRTYMDDPIMGDWTLYNPWRAPGTADIFSPCGIAGGNPQGCPAGDATGFDCPGGGYGFGPDALDIDFKEVITTEWKIGSVVEAAWAIQANHGGGYAYRLCKMPKEGIKGLTEKCFNEGHLNFVGEMQSVQFGDNTTKRTTFKASRTSNGTFPKQSTWTKNPIPACAGVAGGSDATAPGCAKGSQFPPPVPGLEGFGEFAPLWNSQFGFSIVDQLQVPTDLIPGEYVLSFRWDCEQSPQVWNSCANIKMVK